MAILVGLSFQASHNLRYESSFSGTGGRAFRLEQKSILAILAISLGQDLVIQQHVS